MPRWIVIDFDQERDPHSLMHRVRNFGEDLYRACRDDGWAEISLADVDRAMDRLRVRVRSSKRERRIAIMIERLLAEHRFTGKARVSHIHDPS
jgi:hypothetical protein